eukprot:jgi/Mesvir1/19675/Mv09947-RA.1
MAGKVKNLVKNRKKLLPKLLALIISHYRLSSALLFAAGLITAFLLPVVGPRKTYFSENALLPGSANPGFSSDDAGYVTAATARIAQLAAASASAPACVRDVHAYLTVELEDIRGGPRVYLQPFSLTGGTAAASWEGSAPDPDFSACQGPPDHGLSGTSPTPSDTCARDAVRDSQTQGSHSGQDAGHNAGTSGDGSREGCAASAGFAGSGKDTCAAASVTSAGGQGTNLAALLRAYKSDGRESLVLVTPWRCQRAAGGQAGGQRADTGQQAGGQAALGQPAGGNVTVSEGDATSLALGLAFMRHLARAEWLAKDVIWLVPDARWGTNTATRAWVDEYHMPKAHGWSTHFWHPHDRGHARPGPQPCASGGNGTDASGACTCAVEGLRSGALPPSSRDQFLRAGAIGAAIALELHIPPGGSINSLHVDPVGLGGALANLDLVNVMVYSAQREQVDVAIGWAHETADDSRATDKNGRGGKERRSKGGEERECVWGWQGSLWKWIANRADQAASALGSKRRGSTSLRQLVSFMWRQTSGTPTGAHAAFSAYAIDAITVHGVADASGRDERRFGRQHIPILHRVARALEGCVRSANNLLEKLHQSFFFYLLAGEDAYLPIGDYIIPFVLLVACLPLHAAALATQQRPVVAAAVTTAGKTVDAARSLGTQPDGAAEPPLPSVSTAEETNAAEKEQGRTTTCTSHSPWKGAYGPARKGTANKGTPVADAHVRNKSSPDTPGLQAPPTATHLVLLPSQWLRPALALFAISAWSCFVGMLLLPVVLGWRPSRTLGGYPLGVGGDGFGVACDAADSGEGMSPALPFSPPWSLGAGLMLAAVAAVLPPLALAAVSLGTFRRARIIIQEPTVTCVGQASGGPPPAPLAVPPWVALKVVLLSLTSVALVSLALLNFSLAMLSAFVVVPACMAAAPKIDDTSRCVVVADAAGSEAVAGAAGKDKGAKSHARPVGGVGEVRALAQTTESPQQDDAGRGAQHKGEAIASGQHKGDAGTGLVSGHAGQETLDPSVGRTKDQPAGTEAVSPGGGGGWLWVCRGDLIEIALLIWAHVCRLPVLAVVHSRSPFVFVPFMMHFLGGCHIGTWHGIVACVSAAVQQWLRWHPLWYAALVAFYFPCTLVCLFLTHM